MTDAELLLRIERLEAAQAVQNVMSTYEYLHSAYRNADIVELFAEVDDLLIEMPAGVWRGRHRQAAGYVAAASPRHELAAELLRRRGADQCRIRVAAQHRLDARLVDPQLRPLRGPEERRLGLNMAEIGLAALRGPLRESAVEHGDAVVAEGAEQPPDSGRPLTDDRVVDDDGRLVVDAADGQRDLPRAGLRRIEGDLHVLDDGVGVRRRRGAGGREQHGHEGEREKECPHGRSL